MASSAIPTEVVTEVFSFCGIRTLAMCKAIDRMWNKVASDDDLWRQAWHRRFRTQSSPAHSFGWRGRFESTALECCRARAGTGVMEYIGLYEEDMYEDPLTPLGTFSLAFWLRAWPLNHLQAWSRTEENLIPVVGVVSYLSLDPAPALMPWDDTSRAGLWSGEGFVGVLDPDSGKLRGQGTGLFDGNCLANSVLVMSPRIALDFASCDGARGDRVSLSGASICATPAFVTGAADGCEGRVRMYGEPRGGVDVASHSRGESPIVASASRREASIGAAATPHEQREETTEERSSTPAVLRAVRDRCGLCLGANLGDYHDDPRKQVALGGPSSSESESGQESVKISPVSNVPGDAWRLLEGGLIDLSASSAQDILAVLWPAGEESFARHARAIASWVHAGEGSSGEMSYSFKAPEGVSLYGPMGPVLIEQRVSGKPGALIREALG